jgi:DNA invertase Pin-like site-specific DNA recombinase
LKLGYIRVSSKDQNPERQIKKMKDLNIEDRYMFIDKSSGKNFTRPQYQAMLLIIREGDIIYLDALDRLGRNYTGIIDEWNYITRNLKADIVILENENLFDSRKFKTMGDLGKLLEDQFLSMLSYIADQERDKIRQRQAEGIIIAKNKGIKFGRPKKEITSLFMEIYLDWKQKRITSKESMRILQMKPNTFYRRIKEYEDSYL